LGALAVKNAAGKLNLEIAAKTLLICLVMTKAGKCIITDRAWRPGVVDRPSNNPSWAKMQTPTRGQTSSMALMIFQASVKLILTHHLNAQMIFSLIIMETASSEIPKALYRRDSKHAHGSSKCVPPAFDDPPGRARSFEIKRNLKLLDLGHRTLNAAKTISILSCRIYWERTMPTNYGLAGHANSSQYGGRPSPRSHSSSYDSIILQYA